MLRFDLPKVPANVIRWEAFVTTVVCALALWVSAWFMLIPAAQGVVKGFVGHARCPSHRVWRSLFSARGWQGRLENAGPKMFAAKILAVAATVSQVLYATGSAYWKVPVAALIVFSTLEWALSFCAACWAYGLWYRHMPVRGQ